MFRLHDIADASSGKLVGDYVLPPRPEHSNRNRSGLASPEVTGQVWPQRSTSPNKRYGEDAVTRPEQQRAPRIAFARIGQVALDHAEIIVRRWLPGGRGEGHEWVALNPKRRDNHRGSFKVNMRTGRWADFAVGVSG